MPKINPAKKRTKSKTKTTTKLPYTVSFDSPTPAGWRHRNTKWQAVNKAMNQVLDGTYDNARFDFPEANGDEVPSIINAARGAVYRWSINADLDTDAFKVRTSSSITPEEVPFLVAWIEEVE